MKTPAAVGLVGLLLLAAIVWALWLSHLDETANAKAKVEYKNVIKVGKTLDARVLPMPYYNEGLKTEIRTDQANIVIEGARSVLLGRESFVRTTEDGKERQFCVIHLGAEDCYRMY